MPLSSVLGASSVIKPGVCTSTTRPTVPYTGQLIFETDTSRLAVWTGSAWQYETASEGPPGLVYITSVSFTAQTAVAFANATFTNTYRRYLVQISAESTGGDSTVTMQVRNDSGTRSSNSYNGALFGAARNLATASIGTADQASFAMGRTGGAQQSFWSMHVSDPTNTTLHTAWTGTCFLRTVDSNHFGSSCVFSGSFGGDEAHTGLVFNFSVAATGTYNIYGMVD